MQAQILRLLAARRAEGTALLLISHDLAVVSSIADRVLVMKDGVIVEEGPPARVLSEPAHDYTRLLLAAVPSAASRGTRLSAIAGGVSLRAPLPERRVDDGSPVVEVSHLSAAYGSRRVVDDVSFEVHRGETVGIVGESGSGKTTVARLVLGLLAPLSGEVRLNGAPWSGIPERGRRSRRSGIQIISQNPLGSFDPRYTVGRLIAEPLEGSSSDRKARVIELLGRVGLAPDLADRHPRGLSGGQRQRVAIARALAPGPTCSSATNRSPRWTCRSRPRCSTCSRRSSRPTAPR
ncbi:ATP-binding cassette domain-containing protein [Streptosporangium lutulentum]